MNEIHYQNFSFSQVEQCLKQRERELNEHFFAETEALQNKCRSLQDALEIMRKDENIEDFDMTSDGISMNSLKTAFMQLQVPYRTKYFGRQHFRQTTFSADKNFRRTKFSAASHIFGNFVRRNFVR